MKEPRSCQQEPGSDTDRRLSGFMANVSHDLKTPLNAVIGLTSLLLNDVDCLGQEQLHQLKLVSTSAHQLLGRLDALAEFFRLRAGVVEVEADWLDLHQLILQELEVLMDRSGIQGGTIHFQKEGLPQKIRSCSRMISRVLHELLSNATKAGERVTVDGGLQPGTNSNEARLVVSVADTGPGLTPDLMARLSGALLPGPIPRGQGRTNKYEGLGLGLALSREAAGLVGGWIEVCTEPGEPTRFSLVIELSRQDLDASAGD